MFWWRMNATAFFFSFPSWGICWVWVSTTWKDEFFLCGHPLAALEEIIVSSPSWSAAAAPQLLLKLRD